MLLRVESIDASRQVAPWIGLGAFAVLSAAATTTWPRGTRRASSARKPLHNAVDDALDFAYFPLRSHLDGAKTAPCRSRGIRLRSARGRRALRLRFDAWPAPTSRSTTPTGQRLLRSPAGLVRHGRTAIAPVSFSARRSFVSRRAPRDRSRSRSRSASLKGRAARCLPIIEEACALYRGPDADRRLRLNEFPFNPRQEWAARD